MPKIDPSAITQKMYALLKGATPTERHAIVTATLTLFGESLPTGTAGSDTAFSSRGGASLPPAGGSGPAPGALRAFFDAKQPKSKLEQLAVAARYREQHGSTSHTKEDFKAAFGQAKRAFDDRNFRRDLDNAKKAKLFNSGADNQLSYYGEQYVDALPDRKAAAAVKRPGKASGGKKQVKKKA